MNRLESLAPHVVELLRNASPEARRSATLTACALAIESAQLNDACVNNARGDLTTKGELSATRIKELETLAAQLDAEYFDLQESADSAGQFSPECEIRFGQARAVTALLLAASQDSWQTAAEVVYEAAIVVNDNSQFFPTVAALLRHHGLKMECGDQ